MKPRVWRNRLSGYWYVTAFGSGAPCAFFTWREAVNYALWLNYFPQMDTLIGSEPPC